jgi:hypothetical protein
MVVVAAGLLAAMAQLGTAVLSCFLASNDSSAASLGLFKVAGDAELAAVRH